LAYARAFGTSVNDSGVRENLAGTVATAKSLSRESRTGTVVLLGCTVLTAPAIVALARSFLIAETMTAAICRANLLITSSATPAKLAATRTTQAFTVTAAIHWIALANIARGSTPCLRAEALSLLADSTA